MRMEESCPIPIRPYGENSRDTRLFADCHGIANQSIVYNA